MFSGCPDHAQEAPPDKAPCSCGLGAGLTCSAVAGALVLSCCSLSWMGVNHDLGLVPNAVFSIRI